MTKHSRLAAVASLAASGLLVAVGSSSMAAAKTVPPLTVAFDYGSPLLLENFNPFGTNNLSGYKYMFEPLYIVNDLNGRQTPALATSYHWGNSKELIFTMRSGVKWSNGQALTAKDVAFTFNLLKKYPALDFNGLWPTLSSVTAKGNQVIFDFAKADVPDWFFIATTPILPESQWAKVTNPVKFTDPSPVVSGPFKLARFTSRGYTLKPNPDFWLRSKVKIPEMQFMDLTSNTSTDLLLSEGKIDWATIFTPGIKKTYISRNPKYYHYWFPSGSAQVLYLNLTKPPFNQVKFRQALAYAINRSSIALHGEYGYPKPANQAVVPPGIQKGLVPSALARKYAYAYSPRKALRLLAQLGYHKSPAGVLLNPKGKPVQFTLVGPSAYTDMIQDESIITQDLKAIGIKVTEVSTSVSTWSNDYETGRYQMAMGFTDTYPNPWLTYNALLNSNESAKIGQLAPSNYERWNNKATDAALSAYAETTKPAVQRRLMDQIETTLFKDVPVISLFYGPVWYEYQTNAYTGWPTPSNPYADPSNAYPDTLLMAIRVHPIAK